jgi:hypothetical protein
VVPLGGNTYLDLSLARRGTRRWRQGVALLPLGTPSFLHQFALMRELMVFNLLSN